MCIRVSNRLMISFFVLKCKQLMGLSSSSHQKIPSYTVVLPDSILNKPCSEEHLRALAPCIQYWEQFAIYLNISKAERILISYSSSDFDDLKVQSLLTWRRRMGKKATYQVIFNFFEMVHAAESSERLMTVLQKSYPSEIFAHSVLCDNARLTNPIAR